MLKWLFEVIGKINHSNQLFKTFIIKFNKFKIYKTTMTKINWNTKATQIVKKAEKWLGKVTYWWRLKRLRYIRRKIRGVLSKYFITFKFFYPQTPPFSISLLVLFKLFNFLIFISQLTCSIPC